MSIDDLDEMMDVLRALEPLPPESDPAWAWDDDEPWERAAAELVRALDERRARALVRGA